MANLWKCAVPALALGIFSCASSSSAEPDAKAADNTASAEKIKLAPCPEEPGLCFRVTPPTAALTINGEAAGTIQDLVNDNFFMKRPRGIYQISVSAEGFVTWRAEVSISESVETISVNLESVPKGQ